MLSHIKFQFVGAPVSNGLPLYACIIDHMYIKFRLSPHLLERNYCVNLCVSAIEVSLILLFTESCKFLNGILLIFHKFRNVK